MREILQLGDPGLRQISEPVSDILHPAFVSSRQRLCAILAAFRRANGWGRAISAPQIGVPQRFIALDLGDGPKLLINPEIVWTSTETFTMWDDCMSFSTLFVRLRRYRSISVQFKDKHGASLDWSRLDPSTSELLQHEIDHLDGILAIDRAIDRDSIVMREVFEARREYFAEQVDYVIPVSKSQSV
jgi:peptide deformylase